MTRKVGLLEHKFSFRLFKTSLINANFYNLDMLCFYKDVIAPYSQKVSHRKLSQREIIDELLKVGWATNQIYINIDRIFENSHKLDYLSNYSSKLVVYKYINSIYRVVNNYFISYNKDNILSILRKIITLIDDYKFELKGKNIFIIVSSIDAFNIEFISDSLKPFVEEFKRRGLSLNYSLGVDVVSLKFISTKSFDSAFKDKSIFKNLIIKGIESFNDIHANPFRKHEDALIDCFINLLNLDEIKTLPIFVECPKKEPLKLFALISSTLKKDVITKDDIYNNLKIIN